jgi:hypothetical protein
MDSPGFLDRATIRSLIILSRVNHHYHDLCKVLVIQKHDLEVLAEFTTIKQLDYNLPSLGTGRLLGYCENESDNVNKIIKLLPLDKIGVEYVNVEFNVHNTYIINHKQIYHALQEYFEKRFNRIIESNHDGMNIITAENINTHLKYNYKHHLPSELYISGNLFNKPIGIKIHKYNITCSTYSHSPLSVRVDYEFLTILLKDALMKNNMYYIANLIETKDKYITMLKKQLYKYQSSYFIKGHLGNYLKYLGHYKNDVTFNHLIIDKRVKLDKYVNIDYVKDKILYRFWLISHICKPIVYDNMIDVCKTYRELL